jgi:cytochrome P450 family 6
MEPTFLFGNIGDLFLFRKSFPDVFIDLYEQFKSHKFIGGYFMYKPALFVYDPELIKDILVTNFSSFTDRPRYVDEKKDPISAHLFNIGGQKWRDWRFKLSPVFSSGKLKGMFPIMRNCGNDFQSYVTKHLDDEKSVFNFIDLFAKYTTHNIVTIIFSIESDCFDDPNNVFRKMSAKFSESSKRRHIMDIISFLMPNVHEALSIFHVKMVEPKVNEFVLNFVEKVVKHREETNCERNDFMQLLMQLKSKGFSKTSDDQKTITIDELAAQVLVFFVGGKSQFPLLLMCISGVDC